MHKANPKKLFSLLRRNDTEKDEQTIVSPLAYDLRTIVEVSESEDQDSENFFKPKALETSEKDNEVSALFEEEEEDERDQRPLLESHKDHFVIDDGATHSGDETFEVFNEESPTSTVDDTDTMTDVIATNGPDPQQEFDIAFEETMADKDQVPESSNALEMFEASFESLLVHDTSIYVGDVSEIVGAAVKIPFAPSPPASSKAPTPFYQKKDTEAKVVSQFAPYPPSSSRAPTPYVSESTGVPPSKATQAKAIAEFAPYPPRAPDCFGFKTTNPVTLKAVPAPMEETKKVVEETKLSDSVSTSAELETASNTNTWVRLTEQVVFPLFISALLYTIANAESRAVVGGSVLVLIVLCCKLGKDAAAKYF